jgi:hypothetical protein
MITVLERKNLEVGFDDYLDSGSVENTVRIRPAYFQQPTSREKRRVRFIFGQPPRAPSIFANELDQARSHRAPVLAKMRQAQGHYGDVVILAKILRSLDD